MYRKKRIKSKSKFLIILVFIIVIIKFIISTFSVLESESDSVANIEIAKYILKEDYQTMSINLGSLLPREDPYIYTFSIENNDGENRLETNMEYNLTLRTTTNLPLTVELYKNQNYNDHNASSIISNVKTERDKYDTYFTTYKTQISYFGYTEDQKDSYQMVVYFPSIYKSIDYQDVIENIEIIIESKQII